MAAIHRIMAGPTLYSELDTGYYLELRTRILPGQRQRFFKVGEISTGKESLMSVINNFLVKI